jgi:hypothetical protein
MTSILNLIAGLIGLVMLGIIVALMVGGVIILLNTVGAFWTILIVALLVMGG